MTAPDNPERYPVTPDGRYFVVRGRLWRMSNPALSPEYRKQFVSDLMAARRDVGAGLRSGDDEAVRDARQRVDHAKRALGERGAVWWADGAPDFSRRLARNTAYADWFGRSRHPRPDIVEQAPTPFAPNHPTLSCR